MVFRLLKFLLLCAFSLSLYPATVFGESGFSLSTPVFDPYEEVENAVTRFSKSPDLILKEDFRDGLVALSEKKFAEAGRYFESLSFAADIRGYHNLPDFSHVLLDSAGRTTKPEEIRFLVSHAVTLSPTDGRVLLAASSFYANIGKTQALVYLKRAIGSLQFQPVLLSTILSNVGLIILASLTCAFFLVGVIQILRLSVRIHGGLVKVLPRNYRGILAPILLFGLLVLPLYGGILLALGVWSVVIACSSKSESVFASRKFFAYAVASLCFLWGWALPLITTVGYNVKLESSQVFEDLNRLGFSPRGEEILKRQLNDDPGNVVHHFSLGLIMKLRGLSDLAEKQFDTVMDLSPSGSAIYIASKANTGVLEYENKNYESALSIFKDVEADGGKEFELYYNLANVSMLLLEQNQHEVYYKKAKAVDSERLKTLVSNNNLTPKALLYPAPNSLSYSLIFRPIVATSEKHANTVNHNLGEVFDYLLFGSNPQSLSFLALLIILGVFLVPSYTSGRRKPKEDTPEETVGWSLLPGGMPLAGERPIVGACILTVSFAFLLSGIGSPLAFYGEFPTLLSFRKEFSFGALLVFLVTCACYQIMKRVGEKNAD